MKQTILHELANVVTTHWNNDLLPGWTFGGYLNSWFRLRGSSDNFVNLIDLLSI